MARLNHQKKFNNISIANHKINRKKVKAYKIDVEKSEVYEIKIKNSLHHIKEVLDFYNYDEILVSENEFLYLGTDDDYKQSNKPYQIAGRDKNYFGNGVLVRFPANNDNENLQSVKTPISALFDLIKFTNIL